ncbi:MAG TPA: tetratricopeptide repeat protein [Spirochaetota bacterium]|nr:tetratricopeptide repeat protein [Spirochaetota bacterium]HPR47619.1 tetratricopeptide repeat protein [Spirochaetota bacterium]
MKRAVILFLLVCHAAAFSNQFHDRADLLWNKAMSAKRDGNYTAAIENLQHAIIAERKSGNIRNSEYLMQLKELASLYITTGDYGRAVKSYDMAREFSVQTGDRASEAEVIFGLGKINIHLNKDDEALELFNQGLTLEKKLGRKDRIINLLNRIAMVHRKKGEYDRAAEVYNQALENLGSSGFEENRAILMNNLGTVNFYRGRYTDALDEYTVALELDRKSMIAKNLSSDLGNIASVYYVIGKFSESLEYYKKALELDIKNNDAGKASLRFCRVGEIYYLQGDFNKSIQAYKSALEYKEGPETSGIRPYVYSGIGKTYDALGQFDKALEYYLMALKGNSLISRDDTITSRLSDIGMLYESRGKYDEAMGYFSLVLKSGNEKLKNMTRSNNMRNAARVLLHLKKYEEALGYINQALGIDREIKNQDGVVRDLGYLGRYYYLRDDFIKARDTFNQATESISLYYTGERALTESEKELFMWEIEVSARCGKPDDAIRVFHKKQLLSSRSFLPEENYKQLHQYLNGPLSTAPENEALVMIANTVWNEPVIIYRDSRKTKSYKFDKKGLVKHFYTLYEKQINEYGAGVTDALNLLKSPLQGSFHYDFQKIVYYYLFLLAKKEINAAEQSSINKFGRDLYEYFFRQIERDLDGMESIVFQMEDVLMSFPIETLVMADGSYVAEKYMVKQRCLEFPEYAIKERGDASLSLWPTLPESGTEPVTLDSEQYRDFLSNEIARKLKLGEGLETEYAACGMTTGGSIPFIDFEQKAMNSVLDRRGDVNKDGDRATIDFLHPDVIGPGSVHLGTMYYTSSPLPLITGIGISRKNGELASIISLKELCEIGLTPELITVSSVRGDALLSGESTGLLCAALLCSGCKSAAVPLWPLNDRARALFLSRLHGYLKDKNMDTARAAALVKRGFINRAGYSGERDLFENESVYTETIKKLSNPHFWASFILYER